MLKIGQYNCITETESFEVKVLSRDMVQCTCSCCPVTLSDVTLNAELAVCFIQLYEGRPLCML